MKWTPTEDALLRECYAQGIAVAAAKLGRSRRSVYSHAKRIGVACKPHWTEHEDGAIQIHWGHLPIASIAKMLGRTPAATYERAGKLGIRRGCPSGHEFLSIAAKRAGYDTGQLRTILRAAGVRIHRSVSRPSSHARYPRHYVDPAAVDRAVARWLASEPVESAAKRHGLVPATLRGWLRTARAMGTKLPPEPRKYRHRWRVPSSTIDAVIADQWRIETMTAAAVRLGVSRQALAEWLRAAGVPRTPTKYWYVRCDVANDVVRARMAMRLPGHQPGVRRAA
jgi:transposase-like protein